MATDNKSTRVWGRVYPDTKSEAEKVLRGMGISMSAAIGMFIAQVAHDQKLPFTPDVGTTAVRIHKAE